jgi:histidinol-phosphate/aromatic aminotransferase/cobyric acid decarboxylase-like protein
VLGVEDWAEIRRLALSERWSIKRICRERGFARNTVRAAIGLRAENRRVDLQAARAAVVSCKYRWLGVW